MTIDEFWGKYRINKSWLFTLSYGRDWDSGSRVGNNTGGMFSVFYGFSRHLLQVENHSGGGSYWGNTTDTGDSLTFCCWYICCSRKSRHLRVEKKR